MFVALLASFLAQQSRHGEINWAVDARGRAYGRRSHYGLLVNLQKVLECAVNISVVIGDLAGRLARCQSGALGDAFAQ